MKSTLQLKEARGERIDALESIVSTAEGREMTDEETTLSEEIMREVDDLDAQILRSEKLEKTLKRQAVAVAPGVSNASADDMEGNSKNYDLGKAIREAGRGKLSGLEAEMHQEANREFREAGVSPSGTLQIPIALMEKRANTVSSTSNVIGETQASVLAGLVPDSLLERAGANRITGVAGSVLLPSLPSDATAIQTEVAATTSAAMTGVKIDPVKMASMITISNQALNMSSGSFDAVVANQFRKHSGALIDKQFFENVIATGSYMLRKDTANATVPGLGFDNINGLIAELGDDNGLGPNAKFFGSHASMAEARVTEAVSNSGVGILQGDRIAGYEAFASSLCNAGLLTDLDFNTATEVYATPGAVTNLSNEATLEPVFLANMDDTYICYWGGADLVVDEYTSAHLGITRLIMNVYANAKTGHAASAGYFVSDPV